jgi:hypothetical protein
MSDERIGLLLEELGSEPIPEDTTHRHALRRALLHSRTFDDQRALNTWLQWFVSTSTVVASGAVVGAVVVSIAFADLDEPAVGAVASRPAAPVRSVQQELADVRFEELMAGMRERFAAVTP